MCHFSSASGGDETPAVLSQMAIGDAELFILEVIQVGASLVFPIQPPLSSSSVPFSLPHEGNPKRDWLMAKIQAMVTKGVVILLPQDPGLGFQCNLFLVTKETGGTGL